MRAWLDKNAWVLPVFISSMWIVAWVLEYRADTPGLASGIAAAVMAGILIALSFMAAS